MKSFFRKLRHKAILKHIVLLDRVSVLDTSCQDGTFLKVLLDKNSNKNLKVCGVDISKEDIIKAQKIIPGGTFWVTDNKTLPIPDKTFDVVITSLTLHHMPDPKTSLSEMKRVLKDSGYIYLIDIITENRLLYKILNFIKCRESYHFEKFYSPHEVQDLVANAGLIIDNRNPILIFPSISIVTPITIFKIYKNT